MLTGGLLSVVGWGMMWALLSPTTQLPSGSPWPWWLLVVAATLQGQAQLWTDVSVIPTVASNFPRHRGLGIGLSKAYVGLSGSLATAVYVGFFCPSVPHVPSLMLCITIVVGVVCAIGACFVRQRPAVEIKWLDAAPGAHARTSRGFAFGFATTFLLAAVLLVASILDALVDSDSSNSNSSSSSALSQSGGGGGGGAYQLTAGKEGKHQCPQFSARYRSLFSIAVCSLLLLLVAALACCCRDRRPATEKPHVAFLRSDDDEEDIGDCRGAISRNSNDKGGEGRRRRSSSGNSNSPFAFERVASNGALVSLAEVANTDAAANTEPAPYSSYYCTNSSRNSSRNRSRNASDDYSERSANSSFTRENNGSGFGPGSLSVSLREVVADSDCGGGLYGNEPRSESFSSYISLDVGGNGDALSEGQPGTTASSKMRGTGDGGNHDYADPLLNSFTLVEAMVTLDFWLHAIAFAASGGAGLVVINNIAQMVAARGGPPSDADVFVSIISIANCAGRLVAGAGSDLIMNACSSSSSSSSAKTRRQSGFGARGGDSGSSKSGLRRCASAAAAAFCSRVEGGAPGEASGEASFGGEASGIVVPRPLFFCIATLLITVMHVVAILWSTNDALWPITALMGFAYGALNALNPTIASELFGLKSFGAIYGTIGISLCFGS